MRKTVIDPATIRVGKRPEEKWLEIEHVAKVELTSEDENFPIESALGPGRGPGWRASKTGEQVIRLVLDKPRRIRRIRVEFSEAEIERTQEFTLGWSAKEGEPSREIVRQQWNFSPKGSTHEIEDYQVDLNGVAVLELAIKADLRADNAFANLTAWRIL